MRPSDEEISGAVSRMGTSEVTLSDYRTLALAYVADRRADDGDKAEQEWLSSHFPEMSCTEEQAKSEEPPFVRILLSGKGIRIETTRYGTQDENLTKGQVRDLARGLKFSEYG